MTRGETQATSKMILATPNSNDVVGVTAGTEPTFVRYVQQRALFATSEQVLRAAADDLGDISVTDLRNDVTATASADGSAILVTATAASAARAASLSNAVVAAYSDQSKQQMLDKANSALDAIHRSEARIVSQLGQQAAARDVTYQNLSDQESTIAIATAKFGSGVSFVDPATAASADKPALPLVDIVIGLAVGLLIAATVAWLRADRARAGGAGSDVAPDSGPVVGPDHAEATAQVDSRELVPSKPTSRGLIRPKPATNAEAVTNEASAASTADTLDETLDRTLDDTPDDADAPDDARVEEPVGPAARHATSEDERTDSLEQAVVVREDRGARDEVATVPLFGAIRSTAGSGNGPLDTATLPDVRYDSLWASVQDAVTEGVLVLVGSGPRAGTSTCVAHLAASAVASGKRILVVDAAQGASRLSKLLRLSGNGAGFAALLAGTSDLAACTRTVTIGTVGELSVVPAGKSTSWPRGRSRVDAVTAATEAMRSAYDLVIVDVSGSPYSPVNAALLAQSDHVLLVAREGVEDALAGTAEAVAARGGEAIGYVRTFSTAVAADEATV